MTDCELYFPCAHAEECRSSMLKALRLFKVSMENSPLTTTLETRLKNLRQIFSDATSLFIVAEGESKRVTYLVHRIDPLDSSTMEDAQNRDRAIISTLQHDGLEVGFISLVHKGKAVPEDAIQFVQNLRDEIHGMFAAQKEREKVEASQLEAKKRELFAKISKLKETTQSRFSDSQRKFGNKKAKQSCCF